MSKPIVEEIFVCKVNWQPLPASEFYTKKRTNSIWDVYYYRDKTCKEVRKASMRKRYQDLKEEKQLTDKVTAKIVNQKQLEEVREGYLPFLLFILLVVILLVILF